MNLTRFDTSRVAATIVWLLRVRVFRSAKIIIDQWPRRRNCHFLWCTLLRASNFSSRALSDPLIRMRRTRGPRFGIVAEIAVKWLLLEKRLVEIFLLRQRHVVACCEIVPAAVQFYSFNPHTSHHLWLFGTGRIFFDSPPSLLIIVHRFEQGEAEVQLAPEKLQLLM